MAHLIILIIVLLFQFIALGADDAQRTLEPDLIRALSGKTQSHVVFITVQKNPSLYSHCIELSKNSIEYLHSIFPQDSAADAVALWLIASKNYDGVLIGDLLKGKPVRFREDVDLRVALAYLPNFRVKKQDEFKNLRLDLSADPLMKCALDSIQWRFALDKNFAEQSLAGELPLEYVCGLKSAHLSSIPKLDAKRLMTIVSNSTNRLLLGQLVDRIALGLTSDELPILEQLLANKDCQKETIYALWDGRFRMPEEIRNDTYKALLQSLWDKKFKSNLAMDDYDLEQAILCAHLLMLFHNSDKPLELICDWMKKRNHPLLRTWSFFTEALLETQIRLDLLDELKVELQKPSGDRSTDWFLWILNARRGEKVEPLSIKVMVQALNSQNSEKAMDAFANAGQKMFQWLDVARDPLVFFSLTNNGERKAMRFLGVLDRLEYLRINSEQGWKKQ